MLRRIDLASVSGTANDASEPKQLMFSFAAQHRQRTDKQ